MAKEIMILHQQSHSLKEISKQTGNSRCGIQALTKKFEESEEAKDKKDWEPMKKCQNLMSGFQSFFFDRPEKVKQGPGSASGC